MTGFGWSRFEPNTADGRLTCRQRGRAVLLAVDLMAI
jgi:hypothetical protein